MADQPAAGWYPDPKEPGQRRYWDGTSWTEHTDRPGQGAGGAQAVQAPQAPAAQPQAAAAQPQAPAAQAQSPQTPRSTPEAAPGAYQGPVPPGGWQQQLAQRQAWTGEPLAGWGSRVGAYLIDWILGLLLLWLGWVLVFAGKGGIGAVLIVLGLVVAFLYWTLPMSRSGEHNGQTIGKQLLGIRAVRDVGEPFNFGTALLREFVVIYLLFQVIGGFLLGIPWLLDALWPLWDDNNEALHDKLVKTHVVRA